MKKILFLGCLVAILALNIQGAKAQQNKQAIGKATNAIYAEADPLKQEALFKAFRVDFPNENYDMIYFSVAGAFASAKNTEKALFYYNQIKGNFKNTALDIIGERMLKYDPIAAESLFKNDLPRIETNPGLLNLYGKVLLQNGKEEEAFKYIEKAYTTAKNKDEALISTYSYLLTRKGNYTEALPLLEEIVRKGNSNAEQKKQLAIAYEKLNPGKNGGAHVATLENELRGKITEEVKKMLVSESAPSFLLKDANGKNVSLADFKGRTIVLDFWATWCGPCKKSLPAMQLAVNKYKNDPKVKFLFIHTWERVADPVKDAKNYLKDNNYKLDLYMDVKDPKTNVNPAVTLFGVKSIPAKFVIDGNGKIRFKMMGFSGGDDKAVVELSAMIDMAKNGGLENDI